jgi:hypothetical protein
LSEDDIEVFKRELEEWVERYSLLKIVFSD